MNKEWRTAEIPHKSHWKHAWWLADENEDPKTLHWVYVVFGADSLYYVRQWPDSTEHFEPKNLAGPFNDLEPAQAAYRILT